MAALLADLTLDKPRPVHEQIRKHVRRLIVSRNLAAGARLPSDQQLARTWQTHSPTVHLALNSLVREGLLVRVSRVGTFVSQPEPKLTRVGAYYGGGAWLSGTSAFLGVVHAELEKLLQPAGVELSVWADPRPLAEQDRPWAALVKGVQSRKIQALVAITPTAAHVPWLSKLPLPAAYLSTADLPNAVGPNFANFLESSLEHLAAQGCRSVGLIACQPGPAENVADICRGLNLRVRSQWVRTGGNRPLHGDEYEEFGYQEFGALWDQPARPDGLVVFDDWVGRGVIVALSERRVRVPQDLHLVLHRNERVKSFCPLPAAFAVLREREYAAALWTQLQRQVHGEPGRRILIGFHVESPRPKPPGWTRNQNPENRATKKEQRQ